MASRRRCRAVRRLSSCTAHNNRYTWACDSKPLPSNSRQSLTPTTRNQAHCVAHASQAEALSKLAPNARARRFQVGRYELVVEGRRRHIPALLESGLIRQGAVLHMRERGEATMQVSVRWDRV